MGPKTRYVAPLGRSFNDILLLNSQAEPDMCTHFSPNKE